MIWSSLRTCCSSSAICCRCSSPSLGRCAGRPIRLHRGYPRRTGRLPLDALANFAHTLKYIRGVAKQRHCTSWPCNRSCSRAMPASKPPERRWCWDDSGRGAARDRVRLMPRSHWNLFKTLEFANAGIGDGALSSSEILPVHRHGLDATMTSPEKGGNCMHTVKPKLGIIIARWRPCLLPGTLRARKRRDSAARWLPSSASSAATAAPATARSRGRTASGSRCSAATRRSTTNGCCAKSAAGGSTSRIPTRACCSSRPPASVARRRQAHGRRQPRIRDSAPLDRRRGQARPGRESRVTSLTVSPNEQTSPPGTTYRLKVEATFADGSTEDVTGLCSFESLDKHVAMVDRDGVGQVQHGVGDAALIVRYRAEPQWRCVLVPRGQGRSWPMSSRTTSSTRTSSPSCAG